MVQPWEQTVTGRQIEAYSFDGVDDWIVSENNFSIIGNNSRTFNVWWKSGYSDKSFALISSGVGEVETGFEILSKQKPVVHWFGTGRNLSSGEIIAEKWHFISASYDGQKIRLYLDSKYLTQKDASLDTAENSLLIGRPRFDSHFYALGLIDDIRIYDRALSEDEIELLYRAESPNHFVDSAKDLEMIWVEQGTFTMGQAGVTNAEPEHNVTLTKGFYLGKYEVTQAQYEAVMTGNTETDSNGNVISATPSKWPNNPDRPVEKVSWDDVQVFLKPLE